MQKNIHFKIANFYFHYLYKFYTKMNITKRKARSKLLVDESFHAKKLKTNISSTDTLGN